jgi:hypothetical protein
VGLVGGGSVLPGALEDLARLAEHCNERAHFLGAVVCLCTDECLGELKLEREPGDLDSDQRSLIHPIEDSGENAK